MAQNGHILFDNADDDNPSQHVEITLLADLSALPDPAAAALVHAGENLNRSRISLDRDAWEHFRGMLVFVLANGGAEVEARR